MPFILDFELISLFYWAPRVWRTRHRIIAPLVSWKVWCILMYPLTSQYASLLEHLLGCDGRREENFCIVSSWNFCLFSPNEDPDSSLVCFSEIHQRKTVITWREHEHEEEDAIALHDLGTVAALRNCGLLKFFRISSMRQKISLLQNFLNAWDPIN